ncbi:MAG: TRAP transporter large permease [Pseudorhodobacter sp.]
MVGAALSSFVLLLLSGAPIFLVLGIVAAIGFYYSGQPMIGLAQKIIDEINSPTLVAVPMFVIAARIMESGGISRSLIAAANSWVGHFRGGLAYVAVLTCAIFAAISGSSVATAIAMAVILVPAMNERGFPRSFTLGTIGASGTLGMLIPPSLPMIVYAVISDTSVPRLFMAGILPGLLQATLIAAVVFVVARRQDLPREPHCNPGELLHANLRALPALSLPVIVLGGIYGGILTVSEAAGISAVLAAVIAIIFYRQMKLSDLPGVIVASVYTSGSIIIIVAMAFALSHWITETGLTRVILRWVADSGMSAWQFLLVINILLLLLGMFLESFAILLLTLPLLVPVISALGIDPVHFGIVMIVNMEIGLLTPPIGLNLFVLANASESPVATVIKGIWPYMGAMVILLLLVTYVPAISTFLPDLLYGVSR